MSWVFLIFVPCSYQELAPGLPLPLAHHCPFSLQQPREVFLKDKQITSCLKPSRAPHCPWMKPILLKKVCPALCDLASYSSSSISLCFFLLMGLILQAPQTTSSCPMCLLGKPFPSLSDWQMLLQYPAQGSPPPGRPPAFP